MLESAKNIFELPRGRQAHLGHIPEFLHQNDKAQDAGPKRRPDVLAL